MPRDLTHHVDCDLGADRPGCQIAQRLAQLSHRLASLGKLRRQLHLRNVEVPNAGERPVGCVAVGGWRSVRVGHRPILPGSVDVGHDRNDDRLLHRCQCARSMSSANTMNWVNWAALKLLSLTITRV